MQAHFFEARQAPAALKTHATLFRSYIVGSPFNLKLHPSLKGPASTMAEDASATQGNGRKVLDASR